MIQIAIWGIAFILIIKGMDVIHQQKIATSAGHVGSPALAWSTLALAIVFAFILVGSSGDQAKNMPSASPIGTP